MKLLLISTFSLCVFAATGQTPIRELKFPQIGWVIGIPEKSELMDSVQIDSLQNAALRKAGYILHLGQNETLFFVRKNVHNYFTSSLTLADSSEKGGGKDSYLDNKRSLIRLINSHKGSIVLEDTSSSVERIDGLVFEKFYIRTRYPRNGILLETYWYYRRLDSLDLSVNISFQDPVIGNQFLELFRKSKFKK